MLVMQIEKLLISIFLLKTCHTLIIIKILSCSSKTCNEAVWGDLGVEPLALRRAKSKVVWYSKLLGKDKNSYCR